MNWTRVVNAGTQLHYISWNRVLWSDIWNGDSYIIPWNQTMLNSKGFQSNPSKKSFSFLTVCSSKMKQTSGTIELNIYANEDRNQISIKNGNVKSKRLPVTANGCGGFWWWDRHQNRDNLRAIWFCSCQSRIPSMVKKSRRRSWEVYKKKSFKRSLGVEATSDGAFWILILLPFLLFTGEWEDLYFVIMAATWGLINHGAMRD